MESNTTIVVGGGLAGLTAATLLARAGTPALVLESAAALGGRARSTDREGYILNLGPHALAWGGPGTAILRRLGLELPGRSPAVHEARLLVDGRIVRLPHRRAGGPGLRGGSALARMSHAARRGDADGSVAAFLAAHAPDERVAAALTALARLATYADGLEIQAADVLTEQLRGGQVRYLDGGWAALVARLRDLATDAGVEVRTTSPVRRILFAASGAVAGVQLADGTQLEAAAVVLAAGGPTDAARLVGGEAAATLQGWANRTTPVRMASLDVALRTRPQMPALVLGTDEPLYLSVHSDRSRLAPAGGAVVHVARYLTPGAAAPADTRERLEQLLDQVSPGWRGDLAHARYLPNLVVTHDAAVVSTGGRRGRPGPAVPDAPGLFVAGDWVGPTGYLSQASIVSAAAAAKGVVRHLATPGAGRTVRQELLVP